MFIGLLLEDKNNRSLSIYQSISIRKHGSRIEQMAHYSLLATGHVIGVDHIFMSLKLLIEEFCWNSSKTIDDLDGENR